MKDALRAEWTKFRSVRGWVIGMILAAGLMIFFGGFAAANGGTSCGVPGGPQHSGKACLPYVPHGPGGEVVTDSFTFVRQPLTGNGSITARVTALTGEQQAGPGSTVPFSVPWAKAGIIVKQSTEQGSAYAAMMATGGHGVRMQYDYTGDIAGLPGSVSAAHPRWLRLTRSGDTISGYDSADGAHWTLVGTVRLAGLPTAVQVGLFATSPDYTVTQNSFGGGSSDSEPTQAVGVFDHVGLTGAVSGGWTGTTIGGEGPAGLPSRRGSGSPPYTRSGGTFTVTGSGDIAPVAAGTGQGLPTVTIGQSLVGAFVGLIAIVTVAAMFFSTEYRRGLIRTTLAATPRRGAVLAAKAVVIGLVAFVTGLVAAVIAIAIGVPKEENEGQVLLTVPLLTEVRVIAGTAAILALAAVFAAALGAILRRSAAAITLSVLVVVMPFLLSALHVFPAGGGRLAAAADPGRGAGGRAERPAVLPGHDHHLAGRRGLLPAVALRRPGRAVPVDGRGPGAGAGPAPAEGRMSLGCALHAEWTKLRTVPGPAWLLLGVVTLTIAVGAAVAGATHCPAGQSCPVDPVKLSLSGVQLGQAVVAILAVLMIGSEYSSGLIRTTLAAMPNRLVLLGAKAILVAALVLAAGAVAVFGSVLAAHLILPGHGFTAARGFHPVWLSYGPALRAACGSVLYLGLIALLSLGVAVVVRDAAVSIGVVLALLYLFPVEIGRASCRERV